MNEERRVKESSESSSHPASKASESESDEPFPVTPIQVKRQIKIPGKSTR